MSASPESGPNPNMNVCVPSASVMYPSPPEICWHLIAPFTVAAIGVKKSPLVPVGTPTAALANCVGPLYAGSELLHPEPVGFVSQWVPFNGCVIVLIGHWTRKDCAPATLAASATTRVEMETPYDSLMAVRPPSSAQRADALFRPTKESRIEKTSFASNAVELQGSSFWRLVS
jgi:hypothetical protein